MKTIILSILIIGLISCSESESATAKKQCCSAPKKQTAAAPAIDTSQSLYSIDASFTNQNNRTLQLRSFSGKPVVVGMIFTHCGYACPKLTADIQSIEKQLGEHKNDVHYLLVSFDVERDDPKQLRAFAKTYGLDENFSLLHGDEDAVRMLSVLLNVQYEKDADGNFSHSNLVSVLDEYGNLVFRKEGLGADHSETVKAIKALLHRKA